MKHLKSLTTLAASAALTVTLGACQSGGTTADSTSSASSSTQATGAGSAPATSSAASDAATGSTSAEQATTSSAATGAGTTPSTTASTSKSTKTAGTGGDTACSTMTSSQAATAAKAKLPAEPNVTWVEEPGQNQWQPCTNLSYIVFSTQGGTASSPSHIALFHRGVYLGTATKESRAFVPRVTKVGEDAIVVNYRYIKGNESTAGASGRATARFTWNTAQNKVVMSGQVPPAHH